jgi:outer membrane lipoprotein-sorting protein
MKAKVLAAVFLLAFTFPAVAAPDATQLFGELERRLQALKSLEIQYQATTDEGGNDTVAGRMVWMKPDRFLHDTPEWTLCETGNEQWRLLKGQQTLIRENVAEKDDFQPETILFNMSRSLKPKSLTVGGAGERVLRMESSNPQAPGYAVLEFPAHDDIPSMLEFQQADGTPLRYQITRWNENVQPDPSLFTPPSVPPENVIDFRGAGTGRKD